MGMIDPVVVVSILAVVISVVIFGFLIYKIKTLMQKDVEAHRK